MLLNLSEDGGILSKDGFGASHTLGYGSLCSRKGLGWEPRNCGQRPSWQENPEQ